MIFDEGDEIFDRLHATVGLLATFAQSKTDSEAQLSSFGAFLVEATHADWVPVEGDGDKIIRCRKIGLEHWPGKIDCITKDVYRGLVRKKALQRKEQFKAKKEKPRKAQLAATKSAGEA